MPAGAVPALREGASTRAYVSFPIAVQARSPQQETAPRDAARDLGWLGWIDQLAPFHGSTRGGRKGTVLKKSTLKGALCQTAKQTFGRGHETPFSEVVVGLGSGVGTICQLVPSQRSATVVTRTSLPARVE